MDLPINTAEECGFYLMNAAKEIPHHTKELVSLTRHLLTREFVLCSGSGSAHRHHYGESGLLIHTCEVVKTCLSACNDYHGKADLDVVELFLSAIYHDSGKVFDYQINEHGEWCNTPHKRMVNHIPESCIIWDNALKIVHRNFRLRYRDCVMHNILSHHGRQEWGSPVTPKSKAAWVLHLADMTSAMLGDPENRDA